jgi:phosphatidylserine/phosphatidylglycerophosphate/cardiolipin synthase-like enzyme
MVELSSIREVLAALANAKEIAVEAYTLHGAVLNALEAAARRGAHVAVALEGMPFDDPRGHLRTENAKLVAELRGAGVDATLGHPLHAKEISADGMLYLDEKNWRTDDIVLRDADAADSIPMTKHEALAQEAELLRGSRSSDGVVVESESFGSGNAAYSALRALGQAGVAPRLLVSERELRGNDRERRVLDDLIRDGVRVRVCKDSEKLAAAGNRVWLGSANATVTYGDADMTDWGLCTGNAAIVTAVRNRLESEWKTAKEFKFQRA